MNAEKKSRSRNSIDTSRLCRFPFADGRQCRMFRHESHNSLCLFHAREEQQLLELDRIAAELSSLSGEFTTVTDINHVVGKLFKLVAANRLPRRHAELLAYLAQLLLYNQKHVKHEQSIALGYFGWENLLRDIYAKAGLARPSTTSPPAALPLMSSPPSPSKTPSSIPKATKV